jgi:hypothetical protein
MYTRNPHPLSCRLSRNERSEVVAFARARGLSTSGLLKAAVRSYMGSQTAVHPSVYQTQSPEPPPVYAMGILPIRQPARPVPPSKSESRPEQAAMGMDRFDNIR